MSAVQKGAGSTPNLGRSGVAAEVRVCTYAGCEVEATRTVTFPFITSPKWFVGHYCDDHADDVLCDNPAAKEAVDD